MKFVISIMLLGLGIAGLAAGLFYKDYSIEIFLGMIAPMLVSVLSILWMQNIFNKNPEKFTATMAKSFFIKMLIIAIYFIIIIGFYSFQPTPFVISFTGFFILFYIIEATFIQKLFHTKNSKF